MHFVPRDSVVKKSGQDWKLLVGSIGVCAGGALLWWGLHAIWRDSHQAQADPVSTVGGMLLIIISGIATCLSIRCPQCGLKWMWVAVSTQHFARWRSEERRVGKE